LQVLTALNATLDDPTLWKPRVQYYEHRPDQSLVAHVAMLQPPNDTRNATEIEKDINRALNNASRVKQLKVNGM